MLAFLEKLILPVALLGLLGSVGELAWHLYASGEATQLNKDQPKVTALVVHDRSQEVSQGLSEAILKADTARTTSEATQSSTLKKGLTSVHQVATQLSTPPISPQLGAAFVASLTELRKPVSHGGSDSPH